MNLEMDIITDLSRWKHDLYECIVRESIKRQLLIFLRDMFISYVIDELIRWGTVQANKLLINSIITLLHAWKKKKNVIPTDVLAKYLTSLPLWINIWLTDCLTEQWLLNGCLNDNIPNKLNIVISDWRNNCLN